MTVHLQAVGMIEFNSIAVGIESADAMLKAASVEPLLLKTICPGKFLAAVHGGVAAVQASVDAGLARGAEAAADHFVIPNITPSVITAMSCATEATRGGAIGVIETFSAASCVVAADMAVKAADVDLVELRMAMGLGGKAFCTLCGDVAAVEAAVDAGAEAAKGAGLLVRRVVIPSVAPQLMRNLV